MAMNLKKKGSQKEKETTRNKEKGDLGKSISI